MTLMVAMPRGDDGLVFLSCDSFTLYRCHVLILLWLCNFFPSFFFFSSVPLLGVFILPLFSTFLFRFLKEDMIRLDIEVRGP